MIYDLHGVEKVLSGPPSVCAFLLVELYSQVSDLGILVQSFVAVLPGRLHHTAREPLR